jgi:ATP-dependent Lon protease
MKFFETAWENNIPETLPVVPTVDVVAFPHMIIPLLVVDQKIIDGVKKAVESGNKLVVIVACKKQAHELTMSIGPADLFSVGTIANVIRIINLQDGGAKILIQGILRAEISDLEIGNTLHAKVKPLRYEDSEDKKKIEDKIIFIKTLAENLTQNGNFSSDFSTLLSKMSSPDKIADFILSHLTLNVTELQKLLEARSYSQFFDYVTEFLAREAEIVNLHQRVKAKARESMNNAQKEFYIREQIRALKDELGEEVEDIKGFRDTLEEIKEFLTTESHKEIERCIGRLEAMSPESAEATVMKTYLECVFDMPWNRSTSDNNDILHAKSMLDEEHYGLEVVKDRILDFLSVRQLSKNKSAPILCFYGPPGTGKTSLAQSIAKALGRKCFRVSVGGMRDEAEIRGHRRTYVGAIPGRIIKGIRDSESKNPLIVIDEIDKISSDFKGDPASALLEVLDYQQNHSFHDYYLGVPFNLSNVFFIATANKIENISSPLRDRMELIELPAYSLEEKEHIFNKYLLPRALQESGLDDKNVRFDEGIGSALISMYTCEAGVRDLDRNIKKICSRIARIYIEKKDIPFISKQSLEEFLGAPRYLPTDTHRENKIGVSRGLCWTSVGGEIIHIEAVMIPGSGKLILTGQLGDVMKESAQTAFSYLKSHAIHFKIDNIKMQSNDIHVHVPAGGIPKDGPSAGVAMMTALLSIMTSQPVSYECAMTGEIDLQGNVLPVGGIKEKVLAAKRHNIFKVIVPLQNKSDVLDLKNLTDGIEVIYAAHVNDILKYIIIAHQDEIVNIAGQEVIMSDIVPEIVIEEQFA